MGKISPVGLMLKWARESAKISLETASKKINKSTEVIKNWEEEKDFPTYSQLEELSKIYRRPLAIFFFPEPPEELDLYKSFRTLPDFELEKLNTSTIFLIRKAQIMQFNLKELCKEKNPAPRNILKEFLIDIKGNIKEIAQNLRTYLGITLEEQFSWKDSREAFKNWRDILYSFGIFIFKEPFEQGDISGFCLLDEEFPVIYVNNSQSDNRKIFTLFHELGHLITGVSGIDIKNDDFIEVLTKTDWRIEYLCNQLTGSVLVPDIDFDKRFNQQHEVDETFITKLARLYSVSKEVILRKIRDRNRIDENTFNEYLKKWNKQALDYKKKRAETSGGPSYYIKKASYLGEQYIDLVFTRYYREQINIAEAADYLGIKPINFEKFENKILLKA